MLLAVLVAVACSNDAEIPAMDTILYLGKPGLEVTAYPGMNYVSWSPVANASGYVLYVSAGGSQLKAVEFDYGDSLAWVDTEIRDGVEYTYVVEAVSKTSTGRAVVTENSMSDKKTVTAIIPAVGTNVLDLVRYEKEGGGDTGFVVNESNLSIVSTGTGRIAVSLPGKAYLGYKVMIAAGNEYETVGRISGEDWLNDVSKNDVTLYTDFMVTRPGTYKVIVQAQAVNGYFGTSNVIKSNATVNIPMLSGNGGQIQSADYKDIGEIIRVVFSRFTLANGEEVPADYYRLYRSEAGSTEYTQLYIRPEATDATGTQLYVDDSDIDNAKSYEYTLVVTDGISYADNLSVKYVGSYAKPTQGYVWAYGQPRAYNGDNIYNEIEWTIQLPDYNTKITDVRYLEMSVDDDRQPVADDFFQSTWWNSSSPQDATATEFYATTYEHPLGTKVYLLVVTEKENAAVAEYISQPVTRPTTIRTVRFYNDYGYEYNEPITVKETASDDWNKVTLYGIPERTDYRSYWEDGYSSWNRYAGSTTVALGGMTEVSVNPDDVRQEDAFYNEI